MGVTVLLLSMTGYGVGAAVDDRWQARVEARSVNHRYRDVVLHLSQRRPSWEERIRQLAEERVARGRLEIFVVLEEYGDGERTVSLDRGLLAGYARAVQQASSIVGDIEVTLEALLAVPGMFTLAESASNTDSGWPVVQQAVVQALDQLVDMRAVEGRGLQEDMLKRLNLIDGWIDEIALRAPEVVEDYRTRLTDRVRELLGNAPISEDRVATEIAIFADRSCITEELVRAKSHLSQWRLTCASGEPVGRKLDFLLQELNREANTIASKAADSRIAGTVISIKAELEKVREQTQNIE